MAAAKRRGPLPPRPGEVQELLDWAVEHIFERKTVAPEKEILVCALEENLGRANVEELRAALASSREVVPVEDVAPGRPEEDRLRATVENLARERQCIVIVNEGVGQYAPLGSSDQLDPVLKPDQRSALVKLLACTDAVMALRGPAGAGKTTALRQLDAAMRRAGNVPVYVAPQHMGRMVLETDGLAKPDTVSQLLIDLRSGKRSLAGKVLIVDEAGLLSTKAGHALLTAARRSGGRVCFVGDEKQLSSVEAGDFFRLLKDHSRIAWTELQKIQRQIDPGYREAIQAMSTGKVRTGLMLLDAQQRILEEHGDYLDRAADSYVEKTSAGASAILVAPTWAEIDELNARVRAGLRVRGGIAGGIGAKDPKVKVIDRLDLSDAERRVLRSYRAGLVVSPRAGRTGGLKQGAWYRVKAVEGGVVRLENGVALDVTKIGRKLTVGEEREIPIAVGDRLLLQGNNKKLGVSNGMFATVKGLDETGILVDVTRGNRVAHTKLPPTYMTFTHGYAVTAHKSQSATVEHAIVAATTIAGEAIYVATSRGRRTVELHVPDKKRLIASSRDEIRGRAAAVDHAGAVDLAQPWTIGDRRRSTRMAQLAVLARQYCMRRVRETLHTLRETARGHGRGGRS